MCAHCRRRRHSPSLLSLSWLVAQRALCSLLHPAALPQPAIDNAPRLSTFAIMTCNITNTPWVEPLPLYSRNDPDAVSIHSAAPSYVSETPTYHSDRQHVTSPPRRSPPLIGPATARDQPHIRLPTPQFAPGFTSRAVGAVTDLNSHLYNSGSWSSTRSSHASRQYLNVARRRANQATTNTTSIRTSLGTPSPSSTTVGAPSTSPAASSTNLHGTSSPSHHSTDPSHTSQPLNPLEDPYLVGEAAAERARAQRVYREMCLNGEEGLRVESRSWDFMFNQMADWEERGQSWRGFRERIGGTKLLGRRLGLRG